MHTGWLKRNKGFGASFRYALNIFYIYMICYQIILLSICRLQHQLGKSTNDQPQKTLISQEHFVTNDPSLHTLSMKAQSTCKFICWEATERDYAKLFPLENN